VEALKVLRRQVKALWKLEEDLPPKQRERHQWQLVAVQNEVPYLVGKGGANTFFYKVGNGNEMQYGLPDDVLAVIDKWCGERYVMYGITKSRQWERAKRKTKDLASLQTRTPDKFIDSYIVGLNSDGTLDRLFVLKRGFDANRWVPVKTK